MSLLQNSWSPGLSTCPKGFTVTETVNGSLVQSSVVIGVTVYVRTAGEFVEFNNSESAIVVSSVPEVPPVIAPEGELVGASHEYVVPAGIVPTVGVIEIPEPVQISWSISSIDGVGFTVIVIILVSPSQSSVDGVTSNKTSPEMLLELKICWISKSPVFEVWEL